MTADRPVRVLVVEDSAANRAVIVARLQQLGIATDAVADGQQAIAAIGQHVYGLVLMDIRMPVMDGLTATARIRESADPDVPIVAMTADSSEQHRCLAIGMNDYLIKPVDNDRLQAVLQRWLPIADNLLNDRTLRQLEADIDPELIGEMMRLFEDETRQRLIDMQTQAAAGALTELDDQAHTLKSSAETFGLDTVSETARQIEQASRAGDRLQIDRLMIQLVGEIDSGLVALTRRYDR